MLNREQVDTIYRLHFGEKWSIRRIARHLKLDRKTIGRYLERPALVPVRKRRKSKLDPYKERIDELLTETPSPF